jgi:quaternary ammonium compound-resistance protein SugE
MVWTLLVAAALLDIAMAFALKRAEGWSQFWPSLIGFICANAAVFLLTLALRQLPVGTAFAVFTGIGALGVTLTGILLFQESTAPARLLSMMAIFTGIISLKLLDA